MKKIIQLENNLESNIEIIDSEPKKGTIDTCQDFGEYKFFVDYPCNLEIWGKYPSGGQEL